MVRLPLTPAELERGRRLGALLREARGSRPMLDTALDAGISPETLRKIESGRVATPAFTTIAAIADAVGLSLDAVWAGIILPESESESESESEPESDANADAAAGGSRSPRGRLAS